MAINKRVRFWLTLTLTVTLPLWIVPAAVAAVAAGIVSLAWHTLALAVDAFADEYEGAA